MNPEPTTLLLISLSSVAVMLKRKTK
ncbi:MAG: PEP-CTERM sorting domain-containing protein [Phycisphaerae bacterium]|nr:PEP-CTERM sorting domain-containing protein [Phycisphaerae bacterium]